MQNLKVTMVLSACLLQMGKEALVVSALSIYNVTRWNSALTTLWEVPGVWCLHVIRGTNRD